MGAVEQAVLKSPPASLGNSVRLLGGVVRKVALAILVLYLLAPLIAVVYVAFSPVAFFQFPPHGISTRWFVNLWHTPELLDALGRSAWIAVVVAVVTGALATPAAIAMQSRFRGKTAVDALFLSPLLLPELVFALALLEAYSVAGLNDTYLGIILGHMVIAFPYFVRSVYVALAGRDPALEEAAETLGASPWLVFRTVTLPTIRSGLASGAIFAFIVSFDQFTVSLFVVGAHTETLPVAIYNYMFQNSDPTVAAVSSLVIVIGLAAATLANRIAGLDRLLIGDRPTTAVG